MNSVCKPIRFTISEIAASIATFPKLSKFKLLAALPLLSAIAPFPALAQITPAADGTGTIAPLNGNQFNITGGTQAGSNLFHSFQQFGLNPNQTANFVTTPAIQNILGRVVGGSPSVINGLIQVTGSNANLYLMNPAGIVFGSSASLNVPAAFTATTATAIGFGNQWFSANGFNNYAVLLSNPGSFAFAVAQPGAIVNAGNLAVGQGQSLALLGGTVVNTGTLTAPEGQVTVTAVPGSSLVRLSQPGSLLSLEIQPIAPTSALTPATLPELLTIGNPQGATGLAVNGSGQVLLTSSGAVVPSEPGGAIVSGNVNVAGQNGGRVQVLGNQVGLISAAIDATGSSNGGTVLIGGDYQGKGTVPNATQTYVSADSSLRADSLLNGNGGRVIVWADGVTGFYGNISARGGSQAGDGGFAEVSGKQSLIFRGSADLGSTFDKAGNLLLDPTDIVISNGFDPGTTITQATLEALPRTMNIKLEADNSITIGTLDSRDIDRRQPPLLPNDPNNRTALQFDGTNPPLPGAGTPGSIIFTAGGAFVMNLTAPDGRSTILQTTGRDITISAASIQVGDINTNWSNGKAGDITLISSSGAITTGALSAIHLFSDPGGAGRIKVTSAGNFTLTGNIAAFSNNGGNDVILKAPGDIRLNCNGPCIETFSGGLANTPATGDSGIIKITSTGGKVDIAGTNSPTLNASNGSVGGKAGNITITAQNDITTATSTISTSSSNGQSGGVELTTTGNGNISTGVIQTTGLTKGGDVTVTSQGGGVDTRGGQILVDSSQGDSGSITLTANDSITTANLIAFTGSPNLSGGNAGQINLTSTNGSIDTTSGSLDTGSRSGTGGDVALHAKTDVTVGAISSYALAQGNGNAGRISLTSDTGTVSAGSLQADSINGAGGAIDLTGQNITLQQEIIAGSSAGKDSGALTFNSPGAVTLPRNIETRGADIVTSTPASSLTNSNSSTVTTSGGNFKLQLASDLTVDSTITTNGGDITLSSSGTLKVNGTLNSSSSTAAGGTIRLTAPTKIETTTLNTSSSTGAGGAIVIEQPQTVVTGDLITTGVTSGGRVTVRAIDSITTGRIDSSASLGDGGRVLLDPNNNVQITSIRAEGGPSGIGGNVDITTGRFFLATGQFTSQNALSASISTVGGAGGGSITITHNGGNLFTNFNVGNLLQSGNGTAGVLTTGAETIQFGRFFPGSYTQGNIRLITSDRFANGISDSYPDNRPLGGLQLDEGKQVLSLEERNTHQFERSQDEFGANKVLTLDSTQVVLQKAESDTGAKPALVYVGFTPNPAAMPADCTPGTSSIDSKTGKTKSCDCKTVELPPNPRAWEDILEQKPLACDPLELTLVTSKGTPVYIRLKVPYYLLLSTADEFVKAVKQDQSEEHWQPGLSLYTSLFAPLLRALQEKKVQNVSYIMPARLRLLPIAALSDKNRKFLVETYPVGLMPSLSLTDTRRGDLKASQVLAMGATKFSERRQEPTPEPLPYAGQEIENVRNQWNGSLFLNERFTLSNLQNQQNRSPFGILHFATHGKFMSSADKDFYVQMWDQRLSPSQLRFLKLNNPTVELMVLSACETAYGNNVAELGFAGFAHRVGVKSVLGSLWLINDRSTPTLMEAFYKHLKSEPTKIDALVKAQQEMIQQGSHPYHWAAFTLIGNPW